MLSRAKNMKLRHFSISTKTNKTAIKAKL